jgi:hypothetical protein
MPGQSPYFGIRYKCLGEAVNNTDFTNFANDVDAALTTIRTLESAVRKPPMVKWVRDTGSQNVTVATDTNVTFTTVQWDSAAFSNIGVSNTDLTLPSDGIYCASGWVTNVTGFTTLTSVRATVLIAGAVGPEAKAFEGSVAPLGIFKGLAGNVIRLRIRWTGTGGPAQLSVAQLSLFKVCNL